MIPVTTFAGKKVALFGLGASGLASASALLAGGADVMKREKGGSRPDAQGTLADAQEACPLVCSCDSWAVQLVPGALAKLGYSVRQSVGHP
jgi:UDP-N-acetylmuramoylalanine--D-glutamate ligase